MSAQCPLRPIAANGLNPAPYSFGRICGVGVEARSWGMPVDDYVPPGTIFGQSNPTPCDHTSIIATVRRRFGGAPLSLSVQVAFNRPSTRHYLPIFSLPIIDLTITIVDR